MIVAESMLVIVDTTIVTNKEPRATSTTDGTGTWVTPTMQEVVAAMSAVTATNFLILSTICRLLLSFFVQTAFNGFMSLCLVSEFVFNKAGQCRTNPRPVVQN
jgi:hypothetical protein